MTTLAQRIEETGGRASGFDYLRLTLAVAVLLVHSVDTTYGLPANDALFGSWLRPFIRAILPMFFALSGFLVAGSLLRSRGIGTFLWMRAVRIYPALTVEVLLSAFILGPIFTSYTLGRYFSDPLFLRYLVNATGHISFLLPGVFNDNPHPNTVNTQLWTVPFELYCYLTLAVLALAGLKNRRVVGILSIVVISLSLFLYKSFSQSLALTPVGPVSGYLLVASFLAGVMAYLYREVIPYSRPLLWGTLLASLLLLSVVPGGDFLAPLPVAYATAHLGLLNPRRIKLVQGADFSYGIYLYGFVVQQAVVSIEAIPRLWYVNFVVAGLVSSAFAAFSWYWVEKPMLRFKHWSALRRPAPV